MLTSTTEYSARLTHFSAALIDATLSPPGIAPQTRDRLSVYRNNVRLNRIAALTDAFANVVRLVGLDYFQALARAFVDSTPAQSANLHDDGLGLPEFIRGFAPAADFPYLGDVAEVDWLLHRAYFADDALAVDGARLAELGPERFAAASIRLMPSVGLVRSRSWPIADILQMHAGGPPAHLGAGGQSVMIWREGLTVRWQAIAHDAATVLAALVAGMTVQEAFGRTDADAGSLLTQLFGHRLVLAIEEHHP